ncbi:Aste57867_8818 [Aphanomyces stellatus]|uniref:Aste57867_8818 protein n=1 Tax=Aphanomyces stellatus TaxID=120398 RepID=A0A485KL72_9STRA|nr:hypothetical protein As57867_008783 [Aphanomyces stellatus]VFT85704.1 Aste57867_8818 [Aphanomyces stellatus]
MAHPNNAPQLKKNVSVHDMHKIPLDTQQIMEPSRNSMWQLMKHSHFEQYASMPIGWSALLEDLQTKWEWQFDDIIHLQCALTHFSRFRSNTIPQFPSNRIANRSLEWLGDSVLNTCVAIYLFQSYPLTQEGQLTQLRSALINNMILSQVATHLELPDAIITGSRVAFSEGEETDAAVSMRQTIYASAVESLIGAVHVDQGMARAMEFVNTRVLPVAIDLALNSRNWDPVSELQRRLTTQKRSVRYERSKTELLHEVDLYVDNKLIMYETGGNYKDIQRSIASHVLESMDSRYPDIKN